MTSQRNGRTDGATMESDVHSHATGRADELQRLGFVGLGLIHELSTPVSAAQLSLQALILELESTPSLDKAHIIKRLQGEVIRQQGMAQIIHRFRRWLKHEEAELTQVDLADCIGHAIDMVAPGLKISGLAVPSLSLNSTDRGKMVSADPVWLQHVLTGLILNASQAADVRGEEAEVILSIEEHPDKMDILVRDNGDGFVSDQMPAGQSTGPLGLGVGLLLARRLITAMGGHFSIESTGTTGTVVRLRLNKD